MYKILVRANNSYSWKGSVIASRSCSKQTAEFKEEYSTWANVERTIAHFYKNAEISNLYLRTGL